jgi:hypothetical protein
VEHHIKGLVSIGTVKATMVSRVLRVRRKHSLFRNAWCRSGSVEAQGLMEASGPKTEEVTWSNGDEN